MLGNYITMHGAKKNVDESLSYTESSPYELKQRFHEEYLQSLVKRKQAKIQLLTGSQPK